MKKGGSYVQNEVCVCVQEGETVCVVVSVCRGTAEIQSAAEVLRDKICFAVEGLTEDRGDRTPTHGAARV